VRVTVQYFRGNSAMHRMDTASKFIWVLVFGALSFLLTSPELMGLLMVLTIATAFTLTSVKPERVLRSGLWIVLLAGGAMVFQLFARRAGHPVVYVGPIAITDAGIRGGFQFASRIVVLAFSSLAFVWTTDPRDMVVALAHFRVPYRFAYMLFVSLRILPVLENEAMVIREAQAVRGVAEVQRRIDRWKRFGLPLLVAGIRRSESMAVAMDCRGFGAFPTRRFIHEFRWTRSGLLLAAGAVAVAGALLYRNSSGG
jgi:energy-coupling factor transport system permease protein